MHTLSHFLLYRAIRAVLTLWLVVTVVFIVLRLSGDPVRLLLSPTATPAQVEALRQHLGLNQPIHIQYVRYMGDLVQGDFGVSLRQRQPAFSLVLQRLPATIELALIAFAFSSLVGLALGTLAALRWSTRWDQGILAGSSILQATPTFVVGILLILLFTVTLRLLPSSGRGGPQYFIMPVLAIGLISLAGWARLARATLLDVLRQDYVRTARSKGLREYIVVFIHAWRNAALPIVTVMGLELSGLLTGTVIIETIFAWPGLGRLAVEAVAARDYPVVQAAVLIFAVIFIGINVLVDCSYALLDPRVRQGS